MAETGQEFVTTVLEQPFVKPSNYGEDIIPNTFDAGLYAESGRHQRWITSCRPILSRRQHDNQAYES